MPQTTATAVAIDNMDTNFFIASDSLRMWVEVEKACYSHSKPYRLPKVPLA
jgi:hypothetical protein